MMMLSLAQPGIETADREEPAREALHPPARPRLLIVEDDRSSRTAMAALFGRRGFDVRTAETLTEARIQLDPPPQFIVLDLMLPDGNGIEILRRVRMDDLPVRVAVATGAFDWDLLEEVRRLRPDRLFKKPVDAMTLLDWLLQDGRTTPPQ